MIKEDNSGGFGKKNEETAARWCEENAGSYDSSRMLAEACAEIFDFYYEEGHIPQKLYEISSNALQSNIGEFGKFMQGILVEETKKSKIKKSGVMSEGYGQKRAKLTQELPQNRIRIQK